MVTSGDRKIQAAHTDRRVFLKDIAVYGSALMIADYESEFSSLAVDAAAPDNWGARVGIQLTVVRDEITKDFDAALAKVAEIGYKVVEPVGFRGIDPNKFRRAR